MKTTRRLFRETAYLLLFLALVVVGLPILIALSIALFQSSQEGFEGAGQFLQGLYSGLMEGRGSSWGLLLGPYILFTALRLLRAGWGFFREKTRKRRVERAH